MKQKLMLLTIVVALLCGVGWAVRAQSFARADWEYKVISTYANIRSVPPPNVNQLNEAGKDGWELVEIRTGESSVHEQVRTDYYFKRAR